MSPTRWSPPACGAPASPCRKSTASCRTTASSRWADENARKLVKQAIVGALQAGAEDPESPLSGVRTYTDREPDNKKEWIWVYRAKGKREYKVLGPRPAPNEEDIAVMVRVVAIRNKPEDAEARAEALADAVEAALRGVVVGAPVLLPLLVAEVEDEPLDFDAKAGHHYLLTVSTKARI